MSQGRLGPWTLLARSRRHQSRRYLQFRKHNGKASALTWATNDEGVMRSGDYRPSAQHRSEKKRPRHSKGWRAEDVVPARDLPGGRRRSLATGFGGACRATSVICACRRLPSDGVPQAVVSLAFLVIAAA